LIVHERARIVVAALKTRFGLVNSAPSQYPAFNPHGRPEERIGSATGRQDPFVAPAHRNPFAAKAIVVRGAAAGRHPCFHEGRAQNL